MGFCSNISPSNLLCIPLVGLIRRFSIAAPQGLHATSFSPHVISNFPLPFPFISFPPYPFFSPFIFFPYILFLSLHFISPLFPLHYFLFLPSNNYVTLNYQTDFFFLVLIYCIVSRRMNSLQTLIKCVDL